MQYHEFDNTGYVNILNPSEPAPQPIQIKVEGEATQPSIQLPSDSGGGAAQHTQVLSPSPRQGAIQKFLHKLTPSKVSPAPTLDEFQDQLGEMFQPGEGSSSVSTDKNRTFPTLSVARLPKESGGSLTRSLARCADFQPPPVQGPEWHRQQQLLDQQKRRKSKKK